MKYGVRGCLNFRGKGRYIESEHSGIQYLNSVMRETVSYWVFTDTRIHLARRVDARRVEKKKNVQNHI